MKKFCLALLVIAIFCSLSLTVFGKEPIPYEQNNYTAKATQGTNEPGPKHSALKKKIPVKKQGPKKRQPKRKLEPDQQQTPRDKQQRP